MRVWERPLYLVALAVLAIAAVYPGWQWPGAATPSAQVQPAVTLTTLEAENDRLRQQVAMLTQQLDQAGQRPVIALSDVDIAHMKEQGLKDPLKDLVADLEAHPDVIPFQPKYGVQAHAGAWLINSSWVLASAGDGHRGMWALLAYEVENGRIHWTVLATAD